MRHPNSAAGRRRAATPFTARPLALALHVIVFAGASALAAHAPDAWAQGTAAAPAARSYDIPAGPLNSVLTRFSREAGVYLVGAGSLADGKTSPGLKGSYPVQAGFATLLGGTGLEAFRQSDDSYGLRPAPKAAPAPLPKAPAPTAEPGESQLPVVNVKARLERSATTEGTGSYTTRATTLGKTEHSLREIPQSVSVITRQQMEDRNAVTLEDVMVYATGIGAYNNEGQGTASFYARGYGGLQMQYDGVANNAGGMNSQADVAVYDRVEIQRGPAGLLQGSGNPAGTVNLVRKRGQREFALAGSVAAGSWSHYGGDVDVSGPLNDTGSVRGRAVVAARDRQFHYDRAHKRSQTGYLALDIDLAPRTTLGVGLLSQHETATPMAGVVGYTNGVMPAWPRSTNLNAPWGNGTTRIDEVSADLTHALGDDWKLKAGARYRQTAFAYQTARLQSGLDPATGRASALRYEQQGIDENYHAGDVNLSGFFNAFGRRHEVLVGANAEHNDYDYAWAVSSVSGSFDVDNLPYDRSQMANAVPQEGYKSRQSGLYAMTRFKLQDSLTLLLGGRRSNYQSSSRSIAAGTSQAWSTDTEANGKFTPYGGLIWDLTKQLSWYASYADVFMPQSTRDWQGATLKPRIGWQGETGVKGEFFDGALNATLAFFRIRDRNRPMADPDPGHVCNGGSCSMAAGLMQNQGWELDLSGSPLTGLELTAGYTRNTTKYLRDGNAARQGTTAASSTYSPRDAFKAWGHYRFGAGALTGWTVGGGLQAYGPTSAWNGELRQSAYSVASLQMGYQLSRHWKAMLTVNNLFDTTYFRQINGPGGYNYYGEPRNAMLTLRANY